LTDGYKNAVCILPITGTQDSLPLLGMNDSGEEETVGSLLVAKHGNGSIVYTGLSFFRELPEGVPGAYRLLINLLAL